MTTHPHAPADAAVSRSLFVISVFYGGMTCIAGVLGNKLVALGPLAVEAGIFAFLLLVVMSSVVAETSGQKTANRLVIFGFIPLIAAMALIQLVLALPPAPFWEEEKRAAFSLILNQSARLMLAGMIAYGVSQLLNVSIFAALKRRSAGSGRFVWLRGMIAGVLSQTVDTILFITIAFYGVEP
ncbi:MAG: queuosine precursor transporter, partial [Pacificimonas sp.]